MLVGLIVNRETSCRECMEQMLHVVAFGQVKDVSQWSVITDTCQQLMTSGHVTDVQLRVIFVFI